MACVIACPARAQDVSITAVFKPDSAYPHLNKFKNTTPPSGYCGNYPSQCELNETFSLQVPIQFNSRSPILANHASERQGAMLKAPAQWRELTVYHETTREPEKVRVRVVGIGSRSVTDDVMQLVGGADDYRIAHNLLWGSSWVNTPPPCLYSGVGWYSTTTYDFFWKTPEEAVCAKQAKFDVPWMRFDHLDFAYELETPNPLGMSSGHYLGSLTYTVGPNGDFDFGDVMLPSSSALTLNFNLDVQHTLKVDIPPGGEKIQLVPAGGWQSWLQAGRKPVRLFRDQTFNISASSRFKMLLECERTLLFNCLIRDPVSEREAVVQVSVSLPNGLTDMAGQPVKRQPLRIGLGQERQVFQPGFYVDRAPGILHFEMSPYYVNQLLQPGVSGRYVGNITVIWDSEV
ncbi:hypothetical protein C1886_23230 [Pseudomonas sp. FW300-N1A1]|uniref:hypothetical protein n=1 Tax=Pseudomonas sp. FW300-N1A1 TaxID=2075555 RepID=UPI000CD08552|nr:hypothetical protein [Pseudomonas sp. FW300-N1A1]POA17199.1 hypothetical protein C1886_23230 [Pseudomonas sp. FW300-N1A1]